MLGVLFLAIFVVTLVGAYVVIRMRLMQLMTAGWLAAIINFVTFVAYGLTRTDNLLQIVTSAALVGFGITGAMVVMASFFLKNQPQNLAEYDAMVKKKES